MQVFFFAAVLAATVQAQISATGCSNLRSVFTSFGFTTADTAAVNAAFTGCGCSFSVTATGSASAGATCYQPTDPAVPWSVQSISVSAPPTTLSSFPPVLLSTPSNAVGFEWLQRLSFTNNAISGNILLQAEELPTRTSAFDISNNPNLAQWPALNSQGTVPNLSFTTITMNGDSQLCCPVQAGISCVPSTLPACSASGARITSTTGIAAPRATTTTAGVVQPAQTQPVDSSSDAATTTVGVYVKPTLIPYVSPINAPGTIFVLFLAALMFGGGLLMGVYFYIVRRNQKPVQLKDDDVELEADKDGFNTVRA
ncbi:hypothetical protein HDU79_007583 [Rhizoclosmatium sp. JEL0117]|nr:hypothetical protein HDU79_007583 [Rhizoclosmatium sp. JEL0117]